MASKRQMKNAVFKTAFYTHFWILFELKSNNSRNALWKFRLDFFDIDSRHDAFF